MSLILNIDTSLSTASVCLAKDGEPMRMLKNPDQKDHAAWLHPAINELFRETGILPNELNAIAVSIGPGSYTGLRVGLASAKGFCFALNIPLITINTLTLLAYAVKEEATDLVVPMIDARRMEVYTAVFDREIREKISTHTMILAPGSFSSLLESNKIIFCGDGIQKAKSLLTNLNASFTDTIADTGHLACLSQYNFVKNQFASLAYTEPLYVKEFHSPDQKS